MCPKIRPRPLTSKVSGHQVLDNMIQEVVPVAMKKLFEIIYTHILLTTPEEHGPRDIHPRFYINKGDGEWIHVLFKNQATFDSLDMDPQKKIDIVNDLTSFSNSKDDYDEACMAWIRSYILSGPSRIGKSTIIAAMANLLKYDIYYIRLASVKDNAELEKLLIGTSGESIVVIEGIKESDNETFEEIDWILSGSGGGRIIVFNMEKLDPALISERMIKLIDKHIELKEETDMTPSVGRNLKPNMDGGWEYLWKLFRRKMRKIE